MIWIAIDSLSAQRLGFMGYPRPTSPWLDTLAAQSVVFERAFAPSNVTPRSVAATMTGRHYSHIQRDPYEHRLPADFTTLAEWFRDLGFRTTGFNTNPLLRTGTGFSQGFDAYHDLLPKEATKASIEELIAAVTKSYQATNGREFIYLHTMDVHHPYSPPLVDREPFLRGHYRGSAVIDGDLRKPDGSLVFGNLPYFRESQRVDDADIEHLLSLYEGAIRYTDRSLADLLDALHFDPANDLLVVSADHGEQFFEHGYWLHGRSMMPEEIHIPLLVRWDGFASHSVATAISLIDWFPTFAELFSEPPPVGLSGRSLLPALRGEKLADDPVYSEAHAYDASGAAVIADGHLYWLCADNTRLTPWVEWPYTETLCNLDADPSCRHDLSSIDPGQTERLNATLREINPVWRSFTSKAVRPRADAIRHGPQLLQEMAPPTVRLRAGAPPLRLGAKLEEPNQLHSLTLDYLLVAGELAISLREESKPGELWRHRVLSKAEGWQTLRVKLRPGAARLTLRVGVSDGGEAELRSAQLRRLYVPQLPIHVWPGAATLTEAAPAPDGHEADRLRALGYLE